MDGFGPLQLVLASVVAESDCQVLILERAAYRRLADDHPRTASRLLEAALADTAGLLRESLDSLPRT